MSEESPARSSDLSNKYIPGGVSSINRIVSPSIAFERGDGAYMWDEDGNGDASNAAEGRVFHTHWVVLVKDDSVPGGLSVKAVTNDVNAELPRTAPNMPIYLDSPGFSVVLQGNRLRIPVPAWRVRGLSSFNYDAVTAYMQVNTSDDSRPTLGVYRVYSIFSGDLSLPGSFTLPAVAE